MVGLQEIAQECNVRGIPAFHFFKGGVKVDELVGADVTRLERMVQQHYVEAEVFRGVGQRLGKLLD